MVKNTNEEQARKGKIWPVTSTSTPLSSYWEQRGSNNCHFVLTIISNKTFKENMAKQEWKIKYTNTCLN